MAPLARGALQGGDVGVERFYSVKLPEPLPTLRSCQGRDLIERPVAAPSQKLGAMDREVVGRNQVTEPIEGVRRRFGIWHGGSDLKLHVGGLMGLGEMILPWRCRAWCKRVERMRFAHAGVILLLRRQSATRTTLDQVQVYSNEFGRPKHYLSVCERPE